MLSIVIDKIGQSQFIMIKFIYKMKFLCLPAEKMAIPTINSMRCLRRWLCVWEVEWLCFKLSFWKLDSPATARKWTPFDCLIPFYKCL